MKLTPTKTASLYVKEEHDCSFVDVDRAVTKVTARFFFSMFRFAMAHAWECKTIRGRTCYNGDQSSCGCCQAAHAALSPALYDDYLKKIVQNIREVGFEGLSLHHQEYLQRRFALTEVERKGLSSERASIRSEWMRSIVARLQVKELGGTFVDTPLDYARNATFENPAASNRVDCHLERSLRPLEDRLAQGCSDASKNPKEALRELFEVHRELLVGLERELFLDQGRFLSLRDRWENFVASDLEIFSANDISSMKSFNEIDFELQEKFSDYLDAMEGYLDSFEKRFSGAHKGVPKLEGLKRELKEGRPVRVLKDLVGSKENLSEAFGMFVNRQKHLAPINPELADEIRLGFQNGIEEIDKRMAEVQAQLVVVNKEFEDLYELMKMFWGAKNEEGQFVSPTKEDYAQRLNEHVATVTPTRSDLKKQRKIRKRISFNLESSVFESSASSSSSSNYLNDVNRDSSSDKRRRLNGEKESAFGSSLF